MSIGNSRTNLNTPAPPALSNLSKIPAPASSMWQSCGDNNPSGFIGDTIFTLGRNLTSSISNFPGLVVSGTDELYLRWGSAVGSQLQANGWISSSGGSPTGGVTTGVRFGNVKKFTFRGFPSPINPSPVNADPTWFVGLHKGIGAAGLRVGLQTINNNGAQTDAGWRQNNAGIGYVGFVFRPQVSANWLLATGDGAGNATLIDSGIPVNGTQTQLLQFLYDGAIVKWYIGGTLVGAFGTTLPSNNMNMVHFAGVAMVTAVSSTVQNLWNYCYASAEFQ